MTLRSYIILMLLCTIACFFAFLAVVYFFDPTKANLLALILFYFSLLLTLIGIFSIIGLIARIFFTSEHLIFRKVITSFRQAVWFSLLIVISLFLKSANLLIWRNIFFLILAFVILEIFFMGYKSKPSIKI
ncbi:MAG: hypothetical protein WC460_05655 [Patescibacteria group bacterium]